MKTLKFIIPNFFTTINLLSGIISIFISFQIIDNKYYAITSAILILASTIFDFLDGFFAKILNAKSEFGAQMDSFADFVTFGVAPAFLLINTLDFNNYNYLFFLIPIFSAYRLAIFNTTIQSSDYFQGLTTTANGLFWSSSIIMIINNNININNVIIIIISIFLNILMISKIKLFSMKDISLKIEGINIIRLLTIVTSMILIIISLFKKNFIFTVLPTTIMIYIISSLIFNTINLIFNKKTII